MSIESEYDELKRLASAHIAASEKEEKARASLENAQRNFSDAQPERSAYYKAVLAKHDAREALKEAIGAKPC